MLLYFNNLYFYYALMRTRLTYKLLKKEEIGV